MYTIINQQLAPQYTWGNNCSAWILSDDEQLSIKLETMPAGSDEQLHFHEKAQQFFYILKGQATMYIEHEVLLLNPNDGIHIPMLMKHRIANESHDEISFLIISQPNTSHDRIQL